MRDIDDLSAWELVKGIAKTFAAFVVMIALFLTAMALWTNAMDVIGLPGLAAFPILFIVFILPGLAFASRAIQGKRVTAS